MSEHVHEWKLSGLVIDTYPPLDTWFCECGAASHNPGVLPDCHVGHFGQPLPVDAPDTADNPPVNDPDAARKLGEALG